MYYYPILLVPLQSLAARGRCVFLLSTTRTDAKRYHSNSRLRRWNCGSRLEHSADCNTSRLQHPCLASTDVTSTRTCSGVASLISCIHPYRAWKVTLSFSDASIIFVTYIFTIWKSINLSIFICRNKQVQHVYNAGKGKRKLAGVLVACTEYTSLLFTSLNVTWTDTTTTELWKYF